MIFDLGGAGAADAGVIFDVEQRPGAWARIGDAGVIVVAAAAATGAAALPAGSQGFSMPSSCSQASCSGEHGRAVVSGRAVMRSGVNQRFLEHEGIVAVPHA